MIRVTFVYINAFDLYKYRVYEDDSQVSEQYEGREVNEDFIFRSSRIHTYLSVNTDAEELI